MTVWWVVGTAPLILNLGIRSIEMNENVQYVFKGRLAELC